MARRRARTKRTRKRTQKPMINIVSTGAALVSANAVTNGLFGMGIVPWMTEGWFGAKRSSASDNSWEISLSEFFMKNLNMDMRNVPGAWGHMKNPLMSAMSKNLKENGAASVVGLVGAIAVPKILRKTGVRRQGNNLSKQVGLRGVVRL